MEWILVAERADFSLPSRCAARLVGRRARQSRSAEEEGGRATQGGGAVKGSARSSPPRDRRRSEAFQIATSQAEAKATSSRRSFC